MSYHRYFLGSAILVLATAGTINFIVDPANIYREGRITPESYAEALVHSEHGLYSKEGMFDERLLAKAVASKSFMFDCIVIGSSHVMQISSERKQKALRDVCGSILNLGVPGGAIEDHFTLTYLVLKKQRNGRPIKIILGVDPWTFAFGKDSRWSAYRTDYLEAKTEIQKKLVLPAQSTIDIDGADKKKLTNLINLEYTIRSVKAIVRDFGRGYPVIEASPQLDPSVGSDYPIRLRDNSYVYSAKYISEAMGSHIPLGGTTYSTDGVLNQLEAINAYRDLLLWIKSKGVEPILLMTPYHENVLKAPKSLNAIAIKATEPIVLNLARELDLKVIGSYEPKVFGCLGVEFYDFMHPTAGCLEKLRIR